MIDNELLFVETLLEYRIKPYGCRELLVPTVRRFLTWTLTRFESYNNVSSLEEFAYFFTLWTMQTFPLRMFFHVLAEHRCSIIRHEPSRSLFVVENKLHVCSCKPLRLFMHALDFLYSLPVAPPSLKNCFWLSPSESFPISLAWRGRTQLFYFTAQRLQFQYSPGGTPCKIFSHMLTRCDARSTCSMRTQLDSLARNARRCDRVPVLL